MGTVFSKKEVPLNEQLRQNKRLINRAIRELDRERGQLEREEKRLIIDIKTQAKAGQMKSVKIMAKDLVRTRQHISKFIEMRSQMQGTALKLQTIKSHQAMADAMKSTATAMMKMNKAVDAKTIAKMMMEFERENMKSEMTQEMMGDAIDDAMYEEGNEEEEEQIVSQVLDEIGINFDENVPDAPMGMKTNTQTANGQESTQKQAEPMGANGASSNDPAMNELEARLNNLRKDE
jgi:charged multivesicular body protein 2A